MTHLTTSKKHVIGVLSIGVISVLAYLPTVDNFFIADDFGMFTILETALKTPRWFFESTTEFLRLMSYIYFAGCFILFGMTPEPYYWAGIGLHALVSILVYVLVFQLTRSSLAAWAAGIFFAAYERHQEAVMWISAANETILTLNCLLFFLLWMKATQTQSRAWLVLAHVMLAAALLSKEAAVVLVPMAGLQLVLAGHSYRDALRKSSGLLLILAGFAALWLTVSHRNFFITDGHYAVGWHFAPVYARSLTRLLTQMTPLFVVWIVMRARQPRARVRVSGAGTDSAPVIFLGSLLVLAVLPYCFLTYLDHIPSRNAYLPSVGLAGIIGLLFAAVYRDMKTVGTRRLALSLLCLIVGANSAYIWLKKEPQYRERAAPTLELIKVLNGPAIREGLQLPIQVCRFPLDPWTFTEAVTRFTPFKSGEIVLADNCNADGKTVLEWDQNATKYNGSFIQLSANPQSP